MPINTNEIYVISSAEAKPKAVVLHHTNAFATGRDPIVTEATTSAPKWRLHEVAPGSNVYIIALADKDARRILVEDGKVWIDTKPGGHFSIEPAGASHGENAYRIHIPNEDKVFRAGKDRAQVTVAREDGSSSEIWFFDVFPLPGISGRGGP